MQLVDFEAESRKRNDSLDAGAWIDAGLASCIDTVSCVDVALARHCELGDIFDPSYMRIVAASAARLHAPSGTSMAAYAAMMARLISKI